MFLSSCLLLFPMILAIEMEVQINKYVVKIDNDCVNTLKSIKVIGDPSEELNLSGLRLQKISDNAFENVTHIKILNLLNNLISLDWKAATFANLKNLEHLNLSHNNIYAVRWSFIGLSNLKVLDLSRNLITSIGARDFIGLNKACVILLKGNSIYAISTEFFEDKSRTVIPLGVTDRYSNKIPLAFEPRNIFKICINGTKLVSVEHYTKSEKLASGCITRIYYGNGILNLFLLYIVEFQKGWYKLGDSLIYCIDLSANRITRLTSEMFNDLPISISSVNLVQNQFARLEKGFIVNKYLREIDFEFNSITEIEDDVFINTNLTTLNLSKNLLTDTKFAATLPPTLTEINLHRNRIAGISREYLKDLTALEVLNLDSNYITELKLGVFDDLKNIKKIFLGWNSLWNFTINLPESLGILDLQHNDLENLKAGTFVNSPKYELLLNNNRLLNIDDGSFNLPYLQSLDLRYNSLSIINSDKLRGLKNLRNLRLEFNRITTIEEGTFKNLENLCKLSMAVNPIKRRENGTLQRLVQAAGCAVVMVDVPIEMIHRGVFARFFF